MMTQVEIKLTNRKGLAKEVERNLICRFRGCEESQNPINGANYHYIALTLFLLFKKED